MNRNEVRISEIVDSMTSFERGIFHKSDLLPEMLKLQDEMVCLTFNEEHATSAQLRLYDVENHFDSLNNQCGKIADVELRKFKAESKEFCNLIRAEISGNKGESKVFRILESLREKAYILRNIELQDNEERTEIDALVITSSGITIVEVKNTAQDVFITEGGQYFRNGTYQNLDCNIAEKMDLRERLVNKVIQEAGLGDIPIRSVLVFSNSNIVIHNEYPGIKTCFSGQLRYTIEKEEADCRLSDEDMMRIDLIMRTAHESNQYRFDFDINQFKTDFAIVLSALETAKAMDDVEISSTQEVDKVQNIEKANQKLIDASPKKKNNYRTFLQMAACIALSVAAGIIATKATIKR